MTCMKPLDSLKTRRECALKLLEEASEACEAMKLFDHLFEMVNCGDNLVLFATIESYKKNALSELADVAQCICNCLQAMEADCGEWEEEVATVRERNAKRGRHEVEDAGALTMDWVISHDL